MALMQQATIAGNAQYMVYINSDENHQQISPHTETVTSKAKKKPSKSKSAELKIVKRFDVNWKFYKGKNTSEERLQFAV